MQTTITEFEIVPASAGLDAASKNTLKITFSKFFADAHRIAAAAALAIERQARAEADAKAALEQKKAEEAAAKQRAIEKAARDKAEAEAAEERRKILEASAKAEAEAKSLRDAEAKRIADEKAAAAVLEKAAALAAKKAAAAPDRAKLLAFAEIIRQLKMPSTSSPEGESIATDIKQKVKNLIAWIETQASYL